MLDTLSKLWGGIFWSFVTFLPSWWANMQGIESRADRVSNS